MAFRRLQMCVVNTDLIDELAQLVGSQATIMRRLGISWNSWLKIRAGRPILMSVGQRLQTRILADASAFDRFAVKFPCPGVPKRVDRARLEAVFLEAADDEGPAGEPVTSRVRHRFEHVSSMRGNPAEVQ